MAKSEQVATPQKPTPELPPTVPSSSREIGRAILLLGERAKGVELGVRARVELIALVGAYPNPRAAANWKLGLRSVRDDEIFDRTA